MAWRWWRRLSASPARQAIAAGAPRCCCAEPCCGNRGCSLGESRTCRAALGLARDPDRLRAEILGQLSRALLFQDRYEEARRAAEEMTALARRLGDQEGQTDALHDARP